MDFIRENSFAVRDTEGRKELTKNPALVFNLLETELLGSNKKRKLDGME